VLIGTMALSIWSALAFYGYAAGMYRTGMGFFSGAVGAFFVGIYAVTIMHRLWLLSKRYDYTTPVDFFRHRYGSRYLDGLVAFIMLFFIVPYIALQVIGVSEGAVVVAAGDLAFWAVVAVLTVYVIGHVLGGGNNSVVMADTLAGFTGIAIAIAMTVTFLNVALADVGGLTGSVEVLLETNRDVLFYTGTYATWHGVLALGISAGLSIIVWPHIFVRSYMARGPESLRVMATAFPLVQLLSFGMFAFWGVYVGGSVMPGLDDAASDNLVAALTAEYSPALAVLLVIAVFAFGMSTADSQLVVSSSIIQRDVLGQRDDDTSTADPTQLHKVRAWLAGMMALVLVVVAFRPALLVEYAYDFAAPGFAQLMPAAFAGLYWRRTTTAGASAGTTAGLAVTLFATFVSNPTPFAPILLGLAVNTALLVVLSLAQSDAGIHEVHRYLDGVFAPKNNLANKVLMAAVAIVFVQGLLLPPYLPETILFGWLPLQLFVAVLVAFELALIGFFYARNRLDGSEPEFTPHAEVRASR
jgi:solute:Na+ symporter, SSS family